MIRHAEPRDLGDVVAINNQAAEWVGEKERAFFERFLAGGAVLSPRWEVPSVLPGEASAGEMARLKRLFRGAGE